MIGNVNHTKRRNHHEQHEAQQLSTRSTQDPRQSYDSSNRQMVMDLEETLFPAYLLNAWREEIQV